VGLTGPNRKLIAKLVSAFDLRLIQEPIDPQLELMRVLPRADFVEMFPSTHAPARSKPGSCIGYANSLANPESGLALAAISDRSERARRGSFCSHGPNRRTLSTPRTCRTREP
jgi:hypothetical protein